MFVVLPLDNAHIRGVNVAAHVDVLQVVGGGHWLVVLPLHQAHILRIDVAALAYIPQEHIHVLGDIASSKGGIGYAMEGDANMGGIGNPGEAHGVFVLVTASSSVQSNGASRRQGRWAAGGCGRGRDAANSIERINEAEHQGVIA